MKDRLMKNFGLKILSLLIALVIWIMIVNVDDPTITRKFEDIQVTELNKDAITEKDKVYTIKDGKTVDVYVTGRRSIVGELSAKDFVPVADLSKLSITGAVNIEVEVPLRYKSSLRVELGPTKVMTVELEDKVSKKYPVEIELSGEIQNGYTISEKTASPNMIMVSGAESVVNKIDRVYIDISVQDKMTTFQRVVQKDKFLVKDKNGDPIDNSKLEFSTDEVAVQITLQKTKEVNLDINVIGEPANGYKLEYCEYEPKTILVTGDDETLEGLSTITYNYSIEGKSEDYEENLARDEIVEMLKDYGVTLVDESQTIALSLKFSKLENQEISIRPDQVEIRNLQEGYAAEINSTLISALVQGTQEVLKGTSVKTLKPYIDLSGYSTGTKIVPVQFAASGDYIILNKATINITITEARGFGADMN